MGQVTIRELRNRGGAVVDRVAAGERVVVTRDGKPVAELRPVRNHARTAGELVRRWRRLRPVDDLSLRADVDAALDPSL
jgi:prevent-host-death family protein